MAQAILAQAQVLALSLASSFRHSAIMSLDKILFADADLSELPPEKRTRLANTMDEYLKTLAAESSKQAAHQFSQLVDDKVREALKQCEDNSKKLMDESEKRMLTRLQASESETRDLISTLSSRVTAMSVTDATSAVGRAPATSTQIDDHNFIPKKIEIKGYVDYTNNETKAQTSLTKPDVDVWIRKLHSDLDDTNNC